MKCVAAIVILVLASGITSRTQLLAYGNCVREVGSCEDSLPPNYVSLECRILPPGSRCYVSDALDGQQIIHACDDSFPCRAWAGMPLNISCSDENLILFHGDSTDNTSSSYWSFAVSSVVQGVYECRWPNNSVYAYRNTTVDDRVYVMPYCEDCNLYGMRCKTDIAPTYTPGFNCTVANMPQRHESDVLKVQFNVLGARPINLSMEVVWVNHFPVDLHLSYQSTAKSSSILHSAMLNATDLVFVGNASFVRAYLVITAERYFESFTMCLWMELFGDPILLPNDKLPRKVTAAAGQHVEFHCDALTKESTPGIAVSPFTVAFHVLAPPMPDSVQCLNCTFSNDDLWNCRKNVDEGPCSGLQFSNTSSGNPNLLTHSLRAQWRQVQTDQTGWKMVCAIAANGVIQWAHTATLTVTPATPTVPSATPTVTPAPPTPMLDSEGVNELGLGVGSCAVVVVVGCVGVAITTIVIWYRQKYRSTSIPEDKVPLAAPPSPSSSPPTPTSQEGHMLQVRPNGVENVSSDGSSMDSGLDINSTVEVELARTSADGHLLPAYHKHHNC